jgi:hypothetical protein
VSAKQEISIELSSDEALVLFDFLSRYSESNRLEVTDQAEQRVLWDVCALLERVLVEPFSDKYDDLLQGARGRVRDDEG